MSDKNVSGMRTICRWRDRASYDPMRESHILGRVCPPGTPAITWNKRQRYVSPSYSTTMAKERDTAKAASHFFSRKTTCLRGCFSRVCIRFPRKKDSAFDWVSYDCLISNYVNWLRCVPSRPSENCASFLDFT